MRQTPPAHRAASLAVGVAGSNPVAPLLALAMRDYGGHRVVGYGLNEHWLDGDAAIRWSEEPVPACPGPEALVRLSDLVLLTDPSWTATIAKASDAEGIHPPIVISIPAPRLHLRLVAMRLAGRNPLGYSPVPTDAHLDGLLDPDQVWVASQNPNVHDLVERAWRTINNRIPVVHTGFARVSETGLLLSPTASADSVGTSAPPVPPSPPGGQKDA